MPQPHDIDWYERRDELREGMIFRDYDGQFVRLDRTVPGDATQWYVATRSGDHWINDDTIIEPGDLRGEALTEEAALSQ